MAAEGGYKYPRSRPRRQTRVVRVRPGQTFGANDRHNGIDPTESGLPGQCRRRRRRVDIPLAPKMMMVREETSSHYYFYYSYTRRSRSRSRSRSRRRTGRKAGVVRTHTHGTRMPVASARPSSLSLPLSPLRHANRECSLSVPPGGFQRMGSPVVKFHPSLVFGPIWQLRPYSRGKF